MKKIIVFLIVFFASTCFAQQVDVSFSPIFFMTKLINTEETIIRKNLALEFSALLIDRNVSLGYRNWIWDNEIKWQRAEMSYIYREFRPFLAGNWYEKKFIGEAGIRYLKAFSNKMLVDASVSGLQTGYSMEGTIGLYNKGNAFVGIGGMYKKVETEIFCGPKVNFGFMF
ncbi:MAG: hypothetical protein A3K03_04510 [Bdellovibrionales bacterium RIFOXYD1_FULL_44_7]|nr:MAG: hypothetical protein A3K03_04510 [Bdellovibrionales bacterium RIFOXYD1_FULL_44_7]